MCCTSGVQARERVSMLQFEYKCQARRDAGLPLEFSLPDRCGRAPPVSTLLPLFEHRKSPERLAFKSPQWEQERFYLHIHVGLSTNAECLVVATSANVLLLDCRKWRGSCLLTRRGLGRDSRCC